MVTYGLCDLLHNTPLMLNSDEDILIAYESLLEIENQDLSEWLAKRKEEFIKRYPEYQP